MAVITKVNKPITIASADNTFKWTQVKSSGESLLLVSVSIYGPRIPSLSSTSQVKARSTAASARPGCHGARNEWTQVLWQTRWRIAGEFASFVLKVGAKVQVLTVPVSFLVAELVL